MKLSRILCHLQKEYQELSDYTAHKNEVIDSEALKYQVPGGMLSNFRKQLSEQKMEDKFQEVFEEIPVVRKALGWIPLVTPTSQIVGVQALFNVKFGRWKNMSPQAIDIALGYYGKTPAPVDPEVRKIAAEKSGKDPITCRPADILEPRMPDLRKEVAEKGMKATDENCVIYAMFPQQLVEYYKGPKPAAEKPKPAASPAPEADKAPPPKTATTRAPFSTPKIDESYTPTSASVRRMALTINGQRHEVTVEEL